MSVCRCGGRHLKAHLHRERAHQLSWLTEQVGALWWPGTLVSVRRPAPEGLQNGYPLHLWILPSSPSFPPPSLPLLLLLSLSFLGKEGANPNCRVSGNVYIEWFLYPLFTSLTL